MTIRNLLAFLYESAALCALGALLPMLFRLRVPKLLLGYWQAVTVLMLVVPAAQLLRPAPASAANLFRLSATAFDSAGPAPEGLRWILPVLAAGSGLRLAYLAAGLLRLCAMRARAIQIRPGLLFSPDLDTPVSFGLSSLVRFEWLQPTILVGSTWANLPASCQDAVVAHERIHLRRADWPLHLLEETLRALFWFHPAIWFATGQIRVAREQAVDAETVAQTQDAECYIRALLACASPAIGLPVPLFAFEHDLTRRIRVLKQEPMMKPKKAALSFAAIAVCLLAGSRAAIWTFPLSAAQSGSGPVYFVGPGVTSPKVIFKQDPLYTQEAKHGGVQGVVSLTAEITPDGVAHNVRVVNALDPGLDAEAVAAVEKWRFEPGKKDGVPVTVRVSIDINFRLEK